MIEQTADLVDPRFVADDVRYELMMYACVIRARPQVELKPQTVDHLLTTGEDMSVGL